MLKLNVIVFASSIILSHVITELSNKYLQFSQVHKLRFQTHYFLHNDAFVDSSTHIDIYRYSTFDLKWTFLPLNLHLNVQDTCFANVFDPFIIVIILKTFIFTLYFLSGTHIHPDR